FQELQLQRESLLASNRGLAEQSLARRPPLDSGKLQLAEKYRQLASLTTACLEKRGQLGKRSRAIENKSLNGSSSDSNSNSNTNNPGWVALHEEARRRQRGN
ncbi:hypothetical protein CRUP_011141, partial [Coryphaenoides rupestris]